ncbi:MAG TPA: nitrate reductase molybdenum cofactor assembly chaperone [Acetobacteraceae bacterium]|nr:nitrate reductase molybdenum cofactor assembly chaperone [Acetobacteraceae bacterium]
MARTFRALAALLAYPSEGLQAAVGEIETVLDTEALLSPARRAALRPVLAGIAAADIYDLQGRYVDLFDRGRALSLHLFEHVHGESRDRGQAMADLIALYAAHGLEMRKGELPDFLPLFLEFLSLLPQPQALVLLAESGALLRALADRLAARDPGYAAVIEAVAELARAPDPGAFDAGDDDPDDPAALDAAWEEAAVRFGPGEAANGCDTGRLRTRRRADARAVLAAG